VKNILVVVENQEVIRGNNICVDLLVLLITVNHCLWLKELNLNNIYLFFINKYNAIMSY
jgi:hypothetical protein